MRPVETYVRPGNRQEVDCVLVCERDETQEQRKTGEATDPQTVNAQRSPEPVTPPAPTEGRPVHAPSTRELSSLRPARLLHTATSTVPLKLLSQITQEETTKPYQSELFPL